ncbi:hypothetical protein [uncultured Salinicola sp.]|uniref:hypothetical protein n=1 Tax=uncultured Salinicola sp. TaxID=1193542 RepID=UPI002610C0A7|nr:hypothetical protein [uncultured Salinicola sp.]|tara:strand:+ start:3282 stop:3569 length:288 start_codon:yes stop_codon:yes gene_type:complete
MSIMTMKNAFLSALEHLYSIAGQADDGRPSQTIVKGPDGEMLPARREEFLMDDNGVEIADEFVIGWKGISSIAARDGIIVIDLTDGKQVEIEACP